MNEKALCTDEKTVRHTMMATILRASIAAQIRELRKSRGITQEQLADGIGSHQSTIAMYESPTGDWMSVQTIIRIADYFDVALQINFASWNDFLEAYCEDGLNTPKSFAEEWQP